MLLEIVQTVIANQPDMTLLRELPPTGADRWRRPEPDVVVVSTQDINDVSGLAEWLNRWPRARLLVLEISGRETVMYELRPHATALGALSPDQLADMIRRAAED